MKCRICGNENEEGAKYCSLCGSQLEEEKKEEPVFDVAPNNQQYNNIYNNNANKQGQISMITGIIAFASTILCCMVFVGLPMGIIALVFGIIALKKDKQNTSKAVIGIITGAIAIFINILVVIGIVIVLSNPEFMEEIAEAYEQALNEETATEFKVLIKYLLNIF